MTNYEICPLFLLYSQLFKLTIQSGRSREILCVGVLQSCSIDVCCPTNDAKTSLYCSKGVDESLPQAQWTCCPAGTYWDPEYGTCEEAAECGIGGTIDPEDYGMCFADIIKNPPGWLHDSDCKSPFPPPDPNLPHIQGCCNVTAYGTNGYYFKSFKVYGLK